jgi:Fe-S cluster assembly ATP-binding protein
MTAVATDTLKVSGLVAELGGVEILHGVDLEVAPGEVHVVMGPNGSGKSTLAHAMMGRPGTTVTAGQIAIGASDLTALPSWRRARAGLFLALQHPIEVPGVRLEAVLAEALEATGRRGATVTGTLEREADEIGFDRSFLERPLNVDLSGGERKRNEILQLGVVRPRFAVLDEIDSGLDVDALRAVARRIERATSEWGLGVVAVTHFRRLLEELVADRVHVMVDGRIVAVGGPELADELDEFGYRAYEAESSETPGTTPGLP